jgi:hypothetical protein
VALRTMDCSNQLVDARRLTLPYDCDGDEMNLRTPTYSSRTTSAVSCSSDSRRRSPS